MARVRANVWLLFLVFGAVFVACIPSTLDGPLPSVTVPFDSSLRRGSDDIPPTDARLQRKRPASHPEQITLALAGSNSVSVSWITGDYQIGENVVPLDTSEVESIVLFGTSDQDYKNIASGYIHHVQLKGLRPSTKYFYRCGSNMSALSEQLEFTTLPQSSSTNYPERIAIVGDLGLTYNTSSTLEHILRNDPSLLLIVGDLTYSDQYITTGIGSACFSCKFPDAPIRETYQPHWDHWGRFMEPLTSKTPMMVIEGNHEIEPQAFGKKFESYKTRFAVPSKESGSNTSLYYSFNAGGIHFIMLGGYVDYNKTGEQYKWLEQDLAGVDRSVTPWVIAAMHPPWYNSYSSHYREVECMRLEMEDILYNNGVDIVYNGHVHAYERMNRVYDYALNPCAPVYITVGDGGNIEEVDIEHADDPGKCPKPSDNVPQFGGVCATNFTWGPARNRFCWDRQPDWSAVRDGSFGHGILEVKNATHALWTWYRNQDAYGDDHVGDRIWIVKPPQDQCWGNVNKWFPPANDLSPPAAPAPESPKVSPSPSPSPESSPKVSPSPSPSPLPGSSPVPAPHHAPPPPSGASPKAAGLLLVIFALIFNWLL